MLGRPLTGTQVVSRRLSCKSDYLLFSCLLKAEIRLTWVSRYQKGYSFYYTLEQCSTWPHIANRHYVHKPAIVSEVSITITITLAQIT